MPAWCTAVTTAVRAWWISVAEMTSQSAFDAILRETIAEVEAAEAIDASDARQARDEVEQLRLRAAHLVANSSGGPWPTGATVRFQQDPAEQTTAPPTLDIRYPVRPSRRNTGNAATEAPSGRQGRRRP